MTWPEYLGVVLGYQELEETEQNAENSEPVTASEAAARMRRARDSVTS